MRSRRLLNCVGRPLKLIVRGRDVDAHHNRISRSPSDWRLRSLARDGDSVADLPWLLPFHADGGLFRYPGSRGSMVSYLALAAHINSGLRSCWWIRRVPCSGTDRALPPAPATPFVRPHGSSCRRRVWANHAADL